MKKNQQIIVIITKKWPIQQGKNKKGKYRGAKKKKQKPNT